MANKKVEMTHSSKTWPQIWRDVCHGMQFRHFWSLITRLDKCVFIKQLHRECQMWPSAACWLLFIPMKYLWIIMCEITWKWCVRIKIRCDEFRIIKRPLFVATQARRFSVTSSRFYCTVCGTNRTYYLLGWYFTTLYSVHVVFMGLQPLQWRAD